MSILLSGITWNHSRGIVPLQAASQRFSELNPDVEIRWDKRSLQQFADYPIEELTKKYDLLIIDHPWVGTAASTKCVLALNEYLPEEYLSILAENSVGPSHETYNYDGSQWALAIDAASPVASYRGDLFEKNNEAVPETWEQLLQLAKNGKVAVPAIPIDLLMNFYTFCIAQDGGVFTNQDAVTDVDTGTKALQTMRDLYASVDKKMFSANPIAVAEMMTATNDYWYCPFAYGYSNYSRKGYANNILTYADVLKFNGSKLITTLGGTGLSVSAFSNHKNEALNFAQLVCSPAYQATEYIYNGGQPGYSFGWHNDLNNTLTHNYFKNTITVIQQSFVRPRYHGYLHFQDEAGNFVQEYLMGNSGNEKAVLDKMNTLYKQSLKIKGG